MSHSASKIRLHVTNFFSFFLLLPTLTTACECPSDFPVCWANEVPRRCHVDSAVLSPLSNGNGCGGLNVSGAPWAQLRYLWGMQVSADNTTMALTLRLPIDPFSHAGTRWLGDFRAASTAAQAEAGVEYVRAVAPIDLPRIALALGAANVLDAEAAVMATLPLMAGVTLGVVFILVTAAFRSLVVPLRAVLSISLTLAWVYGFLVAVYQHGLLRGRGYRRSSRRRRGCRG